MSEVDGVHAINSTPLSIATAHSKDSKLVTLLLKRGADITTRERDRWYNPSKPDAGITNGNALDVALFFESAYTVKHLLSHAALHLNAGQQLEFLK